ncbi:LysM peptidoglycan-binding domain-containing protein [Roseateles sp. BYS180W]|uniref:LysM peptidoglycan-binding domain-containing protein n=1 Tax=Roseateles rivi TaxID=3299028 RepID=A0ABW7FSX2_9BURK
MDAAFGSKKWRSQRPLSAVGIAAERLKEPNLSAEFSMSPEQKRALHLLNSASSSVALGWREGVALALDSPGEWMAYDGTIKKLVQLVNERLGGSSKLPKLDWHLIRAMLWTETGAKHPQWRTKPMQIGVVGDAGMGVVLAGAENVGLVADAELRANLSAETVRHQPEANIRAGLIYLLNRMCEAKSFEEADGAVSEHQVQKGETFDRIGKQVGCSAQWLLKLNGQNARLAVGQVVKVQATRRGRRITAWKAFTPENLQDRYNGNGDERYAKKLRYCLGVMEIMELAP